MSYTIELSKSLRTFTINDGETILTAAQRNNIALPYGCRNGACSSCKATILDGQFIQKKFTSSALSDDEIKKNIALLCCTEAKSNLKINVHELFCLESQKIKKFSSKIESISKVASDVIVMKLRLAQQVVFDFVPGQYIEFLLPRGIRRAYSIAGLMKDNILEFHIRHLNGGVFTNWLFQSAKVGDLLRFEGPLGTFFLREQLKETIIFIASGTGFAPIKAMIENAIQNNDLRQMILYWGGRSQTDLYMTEIAYSWQKKLKNFSFVPVLTEKILSKNWSGKTGLLHEAVIKDFPNLSNFVVYACGSPIMVESAKQVFITKHLLPEQAFFSDVFTNASEKGVSSH